MKSVLRLIVNSFVRAYLLPIFQDQKYVRSSTNKNKIIFLQLQHSLAWLFEYLLLANHRTVSSTLVSIDFVRIDKNCVDISYLTLIPAFSKILYRCPKKWIGFRVDYVFIQAKSPTSRSIIKYNSRIRLLSDAILIQELTVKNEVVIYT